MDNYIPVQFKQFSQPPTEPSDNSASNSVALYSRLVLDLPNVVVYYYTGHLVPVISTVESGFLFASFSTVECVPTI